MTQALNARREEAGGGESMRSYEQLALAPPVRFYSIEFASPASRFWESLARLLITLGEQARRKGAGRARPSQEGV